MKNFAKKLIYSICFIVLFLHILIFSKQSLYFALSGLTLWFQKMIPALLPFMILSGMAIRLDINSSMMKCISPILAPFYRVNYHCLYSIFIGFLTGFPMGAKTTCDLYKMKRITKSEAQYLLTFCNNIGPIYFITFILPLLKVRNIIPYLIGMYGIPLLYGLFLRHTVYKDKISYRNTSEIPVQNEESYGFFEAIDSSITDSLTAITKLGGYMILFNVFFLIPACYIKNDFYLGITHCLFEITSGVTFLMNRFSGTALGNFTVLIAITFGGFSLFAQTFSNIKGTDLSKKNYIFHKFILTFFSLVYYGAFFFFF